MLGSFISIDFNPETIEEIKAYPKKDELCLIYNYRKWRSFFAVDFRDTVY